MKLPAAQKTVLGLLAAIAAAALCALPFLAVKKDVYKRQPEDRTAEAVIKSYADGRIRYSRNPVKMCIRDRLWQRPGRGRFYGAVQKAADS